MHVKYEIHKPLLMYLIFHMQLLVSSHRFIHCHEINLEQSAACNPYIKWAPKTPVLECSAPLRHFCDLGITYKYFNLLTWFGEEDSAEKKMSHRDK